MPLFIVNGRAVSAPQTAFSALLRYKKALISVQTMVDKGGKEALLRFLLVSK